MDRLPSHLTPSLTRLQTGGSLPASQAAGRALGIGAAWGAALLSSAVLAWRGRVETGSPWTGFNAVSHVVHGDRALLVQRLTVSHTVLGAAVHGASAALWAGLFGWVASRRRRPPTVPEVLVDAAAVTAVAAVVDLKLVPERLSPGFERRLSRPGLALTYGALAVGLAAGGLAWRAAARRSASER